MKEIVLTLLAFAGAVLVFMEHGCWSGRRYALRRTLGQLGGVCWLLAVAWGAWFVVIAPAWAALLKALA